MIEEMGKEETREVGKDGTEEDGRRITRTFFTGFKADREDSFRRNLEGGEVEINKIKLKMYTTLTLKNEER